LFTGDALLASGDGVSPPPSLFSDSYELSRLSLRRLAQIPFVAFADGHDGYVADGRARLDRWLEMNP
jgi:glyoxylase-like metal-dependent hydrolase (beta-lactamase superfamily II)